MPEIERTHRILLVVTTLGFGGAETQVVRLASELSNRGWTVAIACLLKPSAWVEELEKQGIEVHSLDMARGMPDLSAISRLRDLVNAFGPEIVHSHMVHANLLARVTRLFCHMPALICTAHNLRETSERNGPTWYKEVLYRLTDFLADRSTIICHAAYARYVKVGAVPARKLEVIPNGIDIHKFSPNPESRQEARESLGIKDSTFVWLAVGRLVKQKDYSTLLQAVQILPEMDFVLLIAGKGPLQEQLERESRQMGLLDDKVKFLGASENIGRMYAAADAFVMSSVFEGLSAALMEAAAMGLPSVVTDVGGNTEIVTPYQTGYVVPPSNPARLFEAMKKMMSLDADMRQRFGRAARQHCLEQYRLELIMDQWLNLYSRCLPPEPVRMSTNSETVISPITPR